MLLSTTSVCVLGLAAYTFRDGNPFRGSAPLPSDNRPRQVPVDIHAEIEERIKHPVSDPSDEPLPSVTKDQMEALKMRFEEEVAKRLNHHPSTQATRPGGD